MEEMAVKNGFNLKTVHKLIRKHKYKQNKIKVLLKIETNKPNKWITFNFMGNESTRLARTIRKIDKLNNIISNKTEQFNKYDRKGVCKLTCTNCNKFYIGRTNRNFNTRFKEHRKYFRYTEGKSKFSDHVLTEGHDMKEMEETMSIIHLEHNQREINMLE